MQLETAELSRTFIFWGKYWTTVFSYENTGQWHFHTKNIGQRCFLMKILDNGIFIHKYWTTVFSYENTGQWHFHTKIILDNSVFLRKYWTTVFSYKNTGQWHFLTKILDNGVFLQKYSNCVCVAIRHKCKHQLCRLCRSVLLFVPWVNRSLDALLSHVFKTNWGSRISQ